ncbi:GrpB family protein [Amnibacterium kyonggiense]|uniref:GrpB-like predicted nucleotidyltransferase (UPF0157 family) n=1 Tax=Amnibacterium kyonggiense TaxID=595671 RepID=A0A4R7FGP2_9MICO|nr:GrpB family protein [Amnibacterium kyonggiense]TDS75885.1 GrpB-like predicted nucleotidyltransferase (UPF0157 family) [Amnibacterium kyonggiense]
MDEQLLNTPGLTDFTEPPAPEGESPYVAGAQPGRVVHVVEPDPDWPSLGAAVLERVRRALGAADVHHVGSTAVPGLPAKPVIDVDLLVGDPGDEAAYVPALEAAGFRLTVREPWWQQHRMLRGSDPAVNLHVFATGSPESARHRLFRDWLREHPEDRDRYAAAKRAAAAAATAAGEHVQQYNARKEAVVRDIYARLFASIPQA